LSINVETHKFHCWVCGKAGSNLSYLIRKVGNKSDLQAYLSQYKIKFAVNKENNKDIEEYHCVLPKEYQQVPDNGAQESDHKSGV
jgi:hypothetical protein